MLDWIRVRCRRALAIIYRFHTVPAYGVGDFGSHASIAADYVHHILKSFGQRSQFFTGVSNFSLGYCIQNGLMIWKRQSWDH